MDWLKKIIVSRYFLPLLFVFFTFQAVFYAGYIGFGIPSDETYHFGAIQYYADQPITTGPFTHNQDASTIPIVRAIDRTASYLSHYLLSLPDRAMQSIGLSNHAQVIVLRLINVIFAALALYVLKKILDEISNDKLVNNFTVFLMVMTGMAVWIAGAINYDNLANLLFLSFIWTTIKIIKKPDAKLVLSAFILAMATTLTKYTLLPVVSLGIIISGVVVWRKGYRPLTFWRQIQKALHNGSVLAGFLIFLTVLLSGLFIERIGVNLIRYHAVQPSCTKFFTVNECRTNNVYNRNFNQLREYSSQDKSNLISSFDPFSYAGGWVYTMYNTLYFQLGDRRFESELINRIFAALLAVALVVTAILSRARIRLSKSAGYVLALSIFYISLLFIYNLNTYISYGQKYAVQGRYLLPVLGFVYFFTILLVVSTYRNRKPRHKKVFAVIWFVVLALFFTTHFPPYLLARGTDSSWRQEFILPKEIMD